MALGKFDKLTPKKVRQAQIVGDTSMLSELGRRGGEKAARNREQRKAEEELWDEIVAEAHAFEEAARKQSANEDIAPLS